MPPPIRVLALLPALLLLAPHAAGAQDRPPRKRVRPVSAGMTPAQVVATLGPPSRVRTEGADSYLYYAPTCAGCREDYVVVRDCRVVDARLEAPERYFVAAPAGGGDRTPPPPHECRVAGAYAGAEPVRPPEQPRDVNPAGAPPADRPRLTPPGAAPAPAPAVSSVARAAEPDTTLPCPPPARSTDTVPEPRVPGASADEWRRRLALGAPRQRLVALPAAAFLNPTAFGLDFRQAYVGASWQQRTRYTDLDDAAVAVGAGLGDRNRAVGVEVTVSSYSTVRGGGPLETGGVGVKLHRALDARTGIAAGVENVVSWGGSDAGRSGYAVLTRAFRRTAAPSTTLNALVASLGVGSGRFRFEDDVFDEKETVNVFGSLGLQLFEPVALIGEWTGQDLAAAVSVTPLRYRPLVISVGAVDLTRTAGDGPRLVVTAAYGFVIPLPFQ